MHRNGHLGVALLFYAPVIIVINQFAPSLYPIALIGIILLGDLLLPVTLILGVVFSKRWYRRFTFSLCMIPDLDMKIPGIKHRGITHTIWFAFTISIVLGVVSYQFTLASNLVNSPLMNDSLLFAGFCAYLGFHAVITHLIADLITPMGIQPFAPIFPTKVSFGIVRADNSGANLILLLLGIGAIIAVLLTPLQ